MASENTSAKRVVAEHLVGVDEVVQQKRQRVPLAQYEAVQLEGDETGAAALGCLHLEHCQARRDLVDQQHYIELCFCQVPVSEGA